MVKTKSLLILSIFAGSLIWTAALSRPDGRYHIWNTSSKSQVSLLIKSPRGKFALINPGSSLVASVLNDKLPFYEREVDLVILGNKNGTAALGSLQKYFRIQKVWDPVPSISTSEYNLKEQKAPQREWEGLQFDSWGIPDRDLFLKINLGDRSLIYLSRKNPVFWEAVPYPKDAEGVIDGPSNAEIVW